MPLNEKFYVGVYDLQRLFKEPQTIEGLAEQIISEKMDYVKKLIDHEILCIRANSTHENTELIEQAAKELEKIKNSLPCQ